MTRPTRLAARCTDPIGKIDAIVIMGAENPEIERVIKMIAAWCEADELPAAYRSLTGADKLDSGVWQALSWRNYFTTGTIDLDLPPLDANGHPVASLPPVRGCTREIFVRQQDLDRLTGALPGRKTARATLKKIKEIVTRYGESISADTAPSIQDLARFAKKAGLIGHRVELRAEYHRQFPGQVVGRPRNKPSKNLP